MIIIGYQGIGKTTTVKDFPGKYIDLESSTFFNNNIRPVDWYIYYCNIAINLSKQGYNVFISSHKEVRNYLHSINTEEIIIAIVPDISLKASWINRLSERYQLDSTDKNYKALKNAEICYEENIQDIIIDTKTYFNDIIILDSLEYNLDGIILYWKYNYGLSI